MKVPLRTWGAWIGAIIGAAKAFADNSIWQLQTSVAIGEVIGRTLAWAIAGWLVGMLAAWLKAKFFDAPDQPDASTKS